MHAFSLTQPGDIAAAANAGRARGAAFIAGGTDLMQLMKNNVVAPDTLVELDRLGDRSITVADGRLRLGPLATMAEVADHPEVKRGWPAISQALLQSASPQVRNMGTVGGNLLQRTRCLYFRDTGSACNKREPGSGCPAIKGDNRELAILGGSVNCIATHPSDMPVAMTALGATVHLRATDGAERAVALDDFYRLPGDTPHIETVLTPGEIITAVTVPGGEMARRSVYVKVRDRSTFAFALVSACVALDVKDRTISGARVAMGGVAPKPWRAEAVEAGLKGAALDDHGIFASAAEHAPDGAIPESENEYKLSLARRTVARAIQAAAAI